MLHSSALAAHEKSGGERNSIITVLEAFLARSMAEIPGTCLRRQNNGSDFCFVSLSSVAAFGVPKCRNGVMTR